MDPESGLDDLLFFDCLTVGTIRAVVSEETVVTAGEGTGVHGDTDLLLPLTRPKIKIDLYGDRRNRNSYLSL